MGDPSEPGGLSPFGEETQTLPFSSHQRTVLLRDLSRIRTPLERRSLDWRSLLPSREVIRKKIISWKESGNRRAQGETAQERILKNHQLNQKTKLYSSDVLLKKRES
jgi:hypothetical protein